MKFGLDYVLGIVYEVWLRVWIGVGLRDGDFWTPGILESVIPITSFTQTTNVMLC